MDEIMYPLVAVVAWLTVAFKANALRHDRHSPALRAMVASGFFVALPFTLSTPWIYTAFDELLAVPNLARLVSHTSVMALGLTTQLWLLYWVHPTARLGSYIRPRTILFCIAVAVMTVLFMLAPVDEDTLEFSVRYGDAPFVAEYLVVFVGYFAVVLAEVARLCWRYARVATARFLRLGLRLAVVGSILGVAYCVEKAAYVLLRRVGITMLPAELQESAGPVLGGTGALILMTGVTVPAWGPRVAAFRSKVRRQLTFRRLRPLWSDLTAAFPDLVLDGKAARRSDFRFGDLDYRLLRRVIEIRDAQLALRPYLSATTADTARRHGERVGLCGDDLAATVEAAVFRDALRSYRRRVPAAEPIVATPSGGDDLASESAWLARVADAYARSPIVAAVLNDVPQIADAPARSQNP